MSLTARTQAWRDGGRYIRIGAHRIFVRTREGSGLPVLFVHGYPSSSYDWRAVIDLIPDRPCVCFDFLGFGLSDKPRDHVYSLNAQADLVEAIAAHHGKRFLLVAHDMGTSVATELLARDLEGRLGLELAGVLLLNGSMVLERASLTLLQKLLRGPLGPVVARLVNERMFRWQFARIFSAAHPIDALEADDAWSLLAFEGGHRISDRLTYYLHERICYANRWHGALRDWSGKLEIASSDDCCVTSRA